MRIIRAAEQEGKLSIEQTDSICAKPKNRMRNSVSFLLKCKKRGTLVGPTFSGTFFGQKYGKNSAASKQKWGFWEIDEKSFYRVKTISINSQFFSKK